MKQAIIIFLLTFTLISPFFYQQVYAAPPQAIDTFDVDGDGEVRPLTDGLLVIRYLFGFRGESLIDKAIGKGATRTDISHIETYINNHISVLDIDGNGKTEALSDGLLFLRYLYGFDGNTLIDQAIGNGAKRLTADKIKAYIQLQLIPPVMKNGFNVPFLRQNRAGLENIDIAAGAATSLAMILQYHYPDSYIEPKVIYHSGIQNYIYNFGPAEGYRNFRSDINGHGLLLDHVPSYARSYYLNFASGATRESISDYLKHTWGINTQTVSNVNEVYSLIKEQPVLLHVKGNQASGIYADNKFVVLTGIDERDTPLDKADDYFLINDPSKSKEIRVNYSEFLLEFIEGMRFVFTDTALQRKHTVLVDTGHNSISGVSDTNEFVLENPSSWRFAYVDGDYYFHSKPIASLSAKWKPKLKQAGRYKITTTVKGGPFSGTSSYVLYDHNNVEIGRGLVQHRNRDRNWITSIIFPDIKLRDGVYIKAINIPSYSNIDAIKFQYLGD